MSMLFKREFIGFSRSKTSLVVRAGITAFIDLLTGAIFFRVGATDSSVPTVSFSMKIFAAAVWILINL